MLELSRTEEVAMSQESTALVVGVDGSPEGDAALAFALSEAARTGDSVEVVTAWHVLVSTLPYPTLPVGAVPVDRETLRRRAHEVQERALRRVGVPESVSVSCRVRQGAAGPVLVDTARTARLLVVGSRSVGAVRAALLGSVSRYCAHHATCPVVVVPGAGSGRDEGHGAKQEVETSSHATDSP